MLRVFDALVPTIVRVVVARGVEFVVAIVNVDEPPPATEPGANVHVAAAGHPARLNETFSLNPPEGVTVAVNEVDLPRLIVRFDGEAATVKSGTGTAVTTSVTIVDCCGLPDESEAVMVTGNDPTGVLAVVVTVSVLDPEPPKNAVGENDAAVLAGNPPSQ